MIDDELCEIFSLLITSLFIQTFYIQKPLQVLFFDALKSIALGLATGLLRDHLRLALWLREAAIHIILSVFIFPSFAVSSSNRRRQRGWKSPWSSPEMYFYSQSFETQVDEIAFGHLHRRESKRIMTCGRKTLLQTLSMTSACVLGVYESARNKAVETKLPLALGFTLCHLRRFSKESSKSTFTNLWKFWFLWEMISGLSWACLMLAGVMIRQKRSRSAYVAVVRTYGPIRREWKLVWWEAINLSVLISRGRISISNPTHPASAVNPKVQGAWNHPNAFKNQHLDFLIVTSSVATVIDQPGQGNYAAANIFLESFTPVPPQSRSARLRFECLPCRRDRLCRRKSHR